MRQYLPVHATLWWLGMALAAVTYIGLKWGVPALADSSASLTPLASTARSSAALVALVFAGFALFSAVQAYRRRRALDLEMSLAALRALPQERFEHFMRIAFQSEGYAVAERRSADPGVDFMLTRGAERLAVQCRRWRAETIDVDPLLELWETMRDEGACGCVFVTTGGFADAARRFAAGKPLRLVAGHALDRMLRAVERSATRDGPPSGT